ncbi:MAG: 50S ribosomal protein L21 [Bacteroidales bacterium]|nr:50S ribosomal protein L21 [Bacteroidales bacterium]
MYAIVDIAGQQFKVEAGNEIFVNRLAAGKGASVEFDKVLLIAGDDAVVKVGAPYIDGAVVKATVLDDQCRADKVLVFKKIRRKGFQKCNGHRQKLTKIQINAIA